MIQWILIGYLISCWLAFFSKTAYVVTRESHPEIVFGLYFHALGDVDRARNMIEKTGNTLYVFLPIINIIFIINNILVVILVHKLKKYTGGM